MPGIEWTSSLDYTGFADGMRKIQQSVAETAATVDKIGGSVESVFGRMAGVAGIAFSVDAAKGFLNQVMQMRSFFQDIESSMNVFLGSAEKGAEFTQKLKDYAYYNMFEFKDLAAASQQMIAYGQDIDSIIPRLDQLSNVAVGTHGNLMELVSAYNKAKSVGYVDSQGLASWATKGVVVTDVLKEMGVQANSSRVTFEQLNMVLDHVTGEGGMFHDLQLSMMENISAEQGQLEDNINAMLNEIGEKYQDIIIKWYKMHSEITENFVDSTSFVFDAGAGVAEFLIDHYEAIGRTLLSLVSSYGTYRAALVATRAVENSYQNLNFKEETQGLTDAIDEEKKAINELKKSMGELIEEDLKEAVAKGKLTKEAAKALEVQREELSERVKNGELSSSGASEISEHQKELAFLQQMRKEQENLQQEKIAGIEAQIDANNKEIESYRNSISQKKQDLEELEKIRSSYQNDYYQKEYATDAESYASPEYKAFQDANKEYEDAKAAVEEYTSAAEESISTLASQNIELDAQAAAMAGNTSSKEASTIQEDANTVGRRANNVAIGAQIASENADTIATEKNTIAKRLGTIQLRASTLASRVWTVAVGQMRAAVDGLKTAIMTNPIGVFLGAISLALPWIMEWVSGTEEAEETTDAYANTAVKAAGKMNYYIDTLDRCSSSSEQYKEAMSELTKAYNEYGIELDKAIMDGDDEAAKVNELKEHHKELTDVLKMENIERQKAHDLQESEKEREGKDEEAMRDAKDRMSDDISKEDKNQLVGLVSPESIEKVNEAYAKYLEYANQRRKLGELADDKEIDLYNRYKVAVDGNAESVRVYCKEMGYSSTITSEVEKVINGLTKDLAENKREEEQRAEATEKAADAAKKATMDNEEYSKQTLDAALSVDNLKKNIKDLADRYNRTQLNIDVVYNEKNIPSWMKKFSEKEAKHNAAYFTSQAEKAYKSGNMEEGDKLQEKANQYTNQAEHARRERERKEKKDTYNQRIKDAKSRDDINGIIRELKADQGKVDIGSDDDKYYKQAINQLQSKLPSSRKGKGSKRSHNPAEDAAKERLRLFKMQTEEMERIAEERQKMEDAIEDAVVAGIADNAKRERMERRKQHERTLREINDQEEDFKKAAYKRAEDEFNAKNKDKTKVFSDTEVGKAGWEAMKLSEDQQKIIQAQRDKENAEYQRMLDERARADREAYRNFIAEYGTYEQQRLAIAEEYAEKIEKAENPYEKASLAMERQEKEKELKESQAEQNIDWQGVFSDLQGHTTEYLTGLRDQLQGLINEGNLPVDQLAKVREKIIDVNEAITEQSSKWGDIGEFQKEYNRRLAEAAKAQAELSEARKDEMSQSFDLGLLKDQLKEKMEEIGLEATTPIDGILAKLQEGTPEYEAMEQLITKVATGEAQLKAARDKTATATQRAKAAEDSAQHSTSQAVAGWFSDMQKKFEKFGINELPDLFDSLGLGNLGEAASKGLSGFNNAAGAASDFASHNYVGAAVKAIGAVKDFGSMLGIGNGSNAAEVAKKTEELTRSNEALGHKIDALTEQMKNAYGSKAITIYQDAMKAQEKLNGQVMEILKTQMGYHSAHHSNEYYADDATIRGYNADAQAAFQAAGVTASTITGLQSIYNLTPEQLKAIRDFAPELWEYLTTIGKYDKSEYWDNVVEQAGKTAELTKQIQQTLTTTTEENVFSSFLDDLDALANGSEDVFDTIADDWQKMVNKMVVNNLVGSNFQSQLSEWYKKLADVMKKRSETKDIEGFKDELDSLQSEYSGYVHQAQEEIEILRSMGIINGDSEYSQEASKKGFAAMSQDVGEELNGRFTALQIAGESLNTNVTNIMNTLNTIMQVSQVDSSTFSEIRDLAVTRNGYLEDIARYTRRIPEELGVAISNIYSRQEDIFNAIRRA